MMRAFVVNWRGVVWIVSDYLRSLAAKFAPYLLAPARRALFLVGATTRALNLTMLQHRLTSSDSLTAEIRARLPKILSCPPSRLMSPPCGDPDLHKRRAIVLQPPEVDGNGIRKGVLLITFTETFKFFHSSIDIEKLMRYFRIVLEPSWSGYCLPEILFWTKYNQPIIVQASEHRDRRFLKALGTCLVPISVGASDWVDHRVFRPLGLPKDYDVIYVANLSPIKRVHAYLKTVKTLLSRGRPVRAALVLSSWGGNKATFEQLLNLYDLGDWITVFMNLSQPELNELLNRSKVSLLLSKKEGSNRTLFESLFADVPALLLRDNVGVNKEYINQHTGLLVSESELPDAIEHIGKMPRSLSPRTWAMNNIAPEITTQKLCEVLNKQYASDTVSGKPIWVKVNSPEATYMDSDVSKRVPDIRKLMNCFVSESSSIEPIERLDSQIRNLFVTTHPILRTADRREPFG